MDQLNLIVEKKKLKLPKLVETAAKNKQTNEKTNIQKPIEYLVQKA